MKATLIGYARCSDAENTMAEELEQSYLVSIQATLQATLEHLRMLAKKVIYENNLLRRWFWFVPRSTC